MTSLSSLCPEKTHPLIVYLLAKKSLWIKFIKSFLEMRLSSKHLVTLLLIITALQEIRSNLRVYVPTSLTFTDKKKPLSVIEDFKPQQRDQ